MIQVVSTKQLKVETCSQPEAACSSLADLSQQGSSAGFGFAKCHIRVGKLIGFCFNRTRFYREALKNRISSEVFIRWRLLSLFVSGPIQTQQTAPAFSDIGQFCPNIIPVTQVNQDHQQNEIQWSWREQQNQAILLHELSGKLIQYRGPTDAILYLAWGTRVASGPAVRRKTEHQKLQRKGYWTIEQNVLKSVVKF